MADESGKHPATVRVFGTAEAAPGYSLRGFISRGAAPFEWVESKSDEQGGSIVAYGQI
jgi:hypothetical protein